MSQSCTGGLEEGAGLEEGGGVYRERKMGAGGAK